MWKCLTLLFIFTCILSICQAGATTVAAGGSQADASASADEGQTREDVTTPDPRILGEVSVTPEAVVTGGHYLSSKEFFLALLVTAMLLSSLLLQFALLRRMERLRPEDTLRSFGLTLVIIGTIFFIVAGFDSEQIAPAIGLFGTIAGYMLGRAERRGNGRND